MSDRAAIARHAARFERPRHRPPGRNGTAPLWDAGAFRLDQVRAFREASVGTRTAVLAACARNVLAEAWCVEQRGIVYCTAMAQQAESNEARELFLRIGADERQHAAWLAHWIAQPPAADPFIRLIDGLLAAGSPQPLAYLLQVVLEGFGITHYQALSANCRDPAMAQTLRRLAIDEALHHGGGLLVFEPTAMNAAERRFALGGARAFVQMIRVGPQAVVAALAQEIGVASLGDAAAVFAELDTEAASGAKLSRMRALMAQPGMLWAVEELDAGGLFVPCTPAQCAQEFLR
jgi:hypothetical protein